MSFFFFLSRSLSLFITENNNIIVQAQTNQLDSDTDKKTGRVCDLYCKSDVMFLCRINEKYEEHLEMSVANELEMLKTKGVRESVTKGATQCKRFIALPCVFVDTGAHRMISMNEKGECTAVISLSDIFNCGSYVIVMR